MHELTVEAIAKAIGGVEILKGVSLALKAGEVVALLGQSGSGKTTILRSVAGLETPDSGRILLGDTVVFDGARQIALPPEKRGLGLVFQSYALWPNKTVDANVGYGLKLRKAGEAETRAKVGEVLERLGLSALGARYPHQLSGGQQQRVALARALVYRPSVLLLDEPLSNLDAKLREEARAWIRELILQTRISALYVTHDQVEAMAVADRIMLLRGGEVEQEGRPQDVYEQPNSALVADFMGSNNHLAGRLVAREADTGVIEVAGQRLEGRVMADRRPGEAVKAVIRIERVALGTEPAANTLPLTVETALYLGERWEYVLAGEGVRVRAWAAATPAQERYWVGFPKDRLWLF
ncbi:ABC transporter ATP-binding protein [Ancylobacter terrae]|uniref:ABC transporter ATP-binding protein n=1 Tax=Ancylobacter sp. sgz301288 TaxID=3342077 RepID=UPI00385F2045